MWCQLPGYLTKFGGSRALDRLASTWRLADILGYLIHIVDQSQREVPHASSERWIPNTPDLFRSLRRGWLRGLEDAVQRANRR